jgi:predicted negative regulator of RcsB-dependent stress response
VKFKEAGQKGSHGADPFQARGDVLAKQGRTDDAFARYGEPLKYAPNWKQLSEALGTLAKQGD